MKRLTLCMLMCLGLQQSAIAQDVYATVTINTAGLQQADPAIFKSLDQKITDFINLRRWTSDDFGATEKIELNINLTFTERQKGTEDLYSAKLTVQASRPIYGTDYKSSLMNYIDKDVMFRYNQFQNLDFNENRIVGTDMYTSNLTAVLAFYVYYCVGLDYDSYALKGGTPYFNKALNIVQNAPEMAGWRREGTGKNRYWLVDNITNSRFDAFRTNFYEYHRNGLDLMTTDKTAATASIKQNIKVLSQLNKDLPNSAVLFMYFSAKWQEYVSILTESSTAEKEELCPLIAAMDVTNGVKYTELLR